MSAIFHRLLPERLFSPVFASVWGAGGWTQKTRMMSGGVVGMGPPVGIGGMVPGGALCALLSIEPIGIQPGFTPSHSDRRFFSNTNLKFRVAQKVGSQILGPRRPKRIPFDIMELLRK